MNEVLRLLYKEFTHTAVPADLGTKRDRIIKRVTGNNDPYKRSKRINNEKALKLLPYARKLVEEGYVQHDRFKRACLCAIVGNTMEFDIPGHRFTFSNLRRNFREAAKDLVIDDANRIYELAKKADKIITTGTDTVGFAAKEVSTEFRDAYASADLIFAKGMGYAETLTEYKLVKPHALLLRTKCNPVANYFAAPREKNIAKLMP